MAGRTGELTLFNFDTDNANNTGSIAAAVTYDAPSAVPLPASALLLLVGAGALAAARRRRKTA